MYDKGVYYAPSISIHAPREGSDLGKPREACALPDFYPRSPRGERPYLLYAPDLSRAQFLSTLPARGATKRRSRIRARPLLFLSTLPARGATSCRLILVHGIRISIHAPREGSDKEKAVTGGTYHISIHAPREGSDHGSVDRNYAGPAFLSTLPARGATS